jgi:hypothetical protein
MYVLCCATRSPSPCPPPSRRVHRPLDKADNGHELAWIRSGRDQSVHLRVYHGMLFVGEVKGMSHCITYRQRSVAEIYANQRHIAEVVQARGTNARSWDRRMCQRRRTLRLYTQERHRMKLHEGTLFVDMSPREAHRRVWATRAMHDRYEL